MVAVRAVSIPTTGWAGPVFFYDGTPVMTLVASSDATLEETTYEYDGFGQNQLTRIVKPDASDITYTYGADGNRTSRTEGGLTDVYGWDVENRLVSLFDARVSQPCVSAEAAAT